MSDFPFLVAVAGRHLDLPIDPRRRSHIVRNVTQDVLRARLLGDSVERKLHVARGVSSVDVASRGLGIRIQDTGGPLEKDRSRVYGVDLDVILKEQLDILV